MPSRRLHVIATASLFATSAPALVSAGSENRWQRVKPGLGLPGMGVGSCSPQDCQLLAEIPYSGDLTLARCWAWVDGGCPDSEGHSEGDCSNANALSYRIGYMNEGGWPHRCQAWACEEHQEAPWLGTDHDKSWDCFVRRRPIEIPGLRRRRTTTTATSTTRTTTTTTTTTSQTTTTVTTSTVTLSRRRRSDGCYETSNAKYRLDWLSSGRAFFDDWDYLEWDSNNGAAQYLGRDQANSEGVTAAYDTHAILRVGARGLPGKRKTAKVRSRRSWKYFLAAIRFTHVPFGCGLWPAFWTHAGGIQWPEGGELDILEYVNDIASQTSLHTGVRNACNLDGGKINKPGCPVMPDLNGMNYDCTTDYPKKLGCAPNTLPLQSPAEWNMHPVTFAIEWTESFVKIFKIPDYQLPADLLENDPKPDTWDQWLVSYYPLGATGEPDCRNPADVMAPQQLILNIGLCGDWAGKIWSMSATCNSMHGPASGCRAVDPLLESDSENDCCTQFVEDRNGTFGADEYFSTRAYFNMSWVKVFQRDQGEL
mmetsp:Transcript_25979/g.69046  ORF Transcript_25979/g.69046 Transcript_25979/m.69046 type:complete len:537 (+) Transcript_25979:96-1706(+)